MYKKYNLALAKTSLSEFIEHGEVLRNSDQEMVRRKLNEFISSSGIINATDMMEHWFPTVNADVFLSHSHEDEEIALGFAGWLQEKFGIHAFIDSIVWGYASDLQMEIDERYSKIRDGLYRYEDVGLTSSHVHMMLVSALERMIDNTECIMFLNTPNSITNSDVLSLTHSPWLYQELAYATLVREKIPERLCDIEGMTKFAESIVRKRMQVSYRVDITDFKILEKPDLSEWNRMQENSDSRTPLDHLYEITGES
jgi:hypothetical protein